MSENFKFAVISDLHYYSEKLGTTGKAYEMRSLTDQKCLAESGAIIDAAFDEISQSDCDCVIITGDITNNGEAVSHKEIKEKLSVLNKKKNVYLLFSTHDWCSNSKANRYSGDRIISDVEVFSVWQNREFYKEYGENASIDKYITEIGACSYIIKPRDNITVIMINDDTDCNEKSGYSDAHFKWICDSIKKAKQNGDTVILAQHHLVIDSISPLLNGSQFIGDNYERAEKLADCGVDLLICGHSHMQRISGYTSKKGNKLVQLNQGSLCGYSAPVTYITVNNGELNIDTKHIEKFIYNGKTYTSDYLKNHTTDVLLCFLNYAVNDKKKFFELSNHLGIVIRPKILYYPIKAAAKIILSVSAGKVGKIINTVTFGKGINPENLNRVKNIRLIDYAVDIFLCLFDIPEDKNDGYFNAFTDIASLPLRMLRRFHIKHGKPYNTAMQISYTAKRITGKEYEK